MLDVIGFVLDAASNLTYLRLRSAAGATLGLALDLGLIWVRAPKTAGEFACLVALFFVCFVAGCLWDYHALQRRQRDS